MTWYEVVHGPELRQGDLLKGLFVPTIVQVPADFAADDVDSVRYRLDVSDAIVLSQSCDLENGKLEFVMVAAFDSWPNLVATEYSSMGRKEREKIQREIRRGHRHHLHLLDSAEGQLPMDFSIVDFRSLHTLPLDYLEAHASDQGARLRLLAPYREHLSQSFGRYMMRVALERDPVEFEEWAPPVS